MMVGISEYYDKRKGRGYSTTSVVTRNPKIRKELKNKLKGINHYYDEIEETKIRYRFRFPHMTKKQVQMMLNEIDGKGEK